jgi:hypothetical protein
MKKLQFTVWTSWDPPDDMYDDRDGDERPPEKSFNSSYDTIEEANERAEYVFFHEFPWGEDYYRMDDEEEVEIPHAKVDFVSSKTGLRRLHCRPEDSTLGDHWTVSVLPSIAFAYIDV